VAENCFPCANNAADSLPPRERIYDDGLWRVAHAFNSAQPGWLVAVLRRHATSLGELSQREGLSLGRLVPALSRALQEELGVPKAYLAFLAEQEGFAHIHLHVVARPAPDARGPAVFNLLQRPQSEWMTTSEMDDLAERLSRLLTAENLAN
jgi:diadenosine tetraphosphate (Ap4A) HIT family hydrolase